MKTNKKEETWMLGFNEAGSKKAGIILIKLFAFLVILFGLIMFISFKIVGITIIVGGVLIWQVAKKAK